jgi:hypothetical protein
MKKVLATLIVFLFFFSNYLLAQNTFPSTGPAGINTTTLDADLRINNTYSIDNSNCSALGIPALKILRTDVLPGFCPSGSLGGPITYIPYPIGPVIVDIQKYANITNWSTGLSSWQLDPVLLINGSGNTGIGMAPFGSNRLSVNGNSYFNSSAYFGNNVQVKNKFRINSAVLNPGDWTASSFPYSFGVDNGNSRFLGDIDVQGANINTNSGNNTVTNGNMIVSNGQMIVQNGNIRTQNAAGVSNFRVDANGLLIARQVDVHLDPIPDYVFHAAFDDDSASHYSKIGFYKAMTLPELDEFVQLNRHLPGIKSATEYQAQGSINIGELQLKLLQKVEELSLYNIELLKDINELKKKQIELELTLSNLKN